MVGLFPQLPDGWRWDTPGAGEMVGELVEQICRKYPRVDRDRVYLSGLSMGGATAPAFAATQGQWVAVPVYAGGTYIGDAVDRQGELWISVSVLDVAAKDAFVVKSGGLGDDRPAGRVASRSPRRRTGRGGRVAAPGRAGVRPRGGRHGS